VDTEPVYSAYVAHNPPVFARLMALHVPVGGLVADVTYGRGTFWKDIAPDIYRVLPSDIETGTDLRSLPYADGSLDAVVLDPPYMEGLYRLVHQAPVSHGDFRDRYSQAVAVDGSGVKYHAAVLEMYRLGIAEAARVLRARGILVVKCQDEVSNHRQHLTHVDVVLYARESGLVEVDLFVVVRPDRPSVGRIKRQQHARKRHSYFLVFKK
jgi:hypothetical protein